MIEQRAIPIKNIEVREEDDKRVIDMYPAVFNSWSKDLGGFKERTLPGAFSETIENDDIVAAYNHDSNIVLGRNTAGTLELEEDGKGLRAVIDPPEGMWGDYVISLIKRGDIPGGSFAFETLEDNWRKGEEIDERELIKVRLVDIGPVTYPAYPDTQVQARSIFESDDIDYRRLSSIMLRAERGIDLNERDRDVINNTIQLLKSYLGSSHSERDVGGLEMMKRRLEVAEKSI